MNKAKEEIRLSPRAARKLIHDALVGAGTAPANAGYFTDAILDTELSGLEGHGFYWLQYYCEHVKSGKVNGKARAKIKRLSPVAFRVDANRGFAHPAIEAGFARLIPAAEKNGIAAMAVHNSYSAAIPRRSSRQWVAQRRSSAPIRCPSPCRASARARSPS
jgi:(2R)-3-sulfolactate dehydrogenase (NADP+)